MNPVALVTGGARGIGWACAKALLDAGYAVATLDILPLSKSLPVLELQGDVGDAIAVETVIRQILAHYGRLDVAINNAAILGQRNHISDGNLENWQRVLQTNLTGTWLCLKYEVSAMLKTGGGHIVNLSSTSSSGGVGVDIMHYGGYVVSKAALNKLTEVTALLYQKDHLYINCILATGYKTELHKELRGAYTGKDPSQMGQLVAAICKYDGTGIVDDEEGWTKRVWG